MGELSSLHYQIELYRALVDGLVSALSANRELIGWITQNRGEVFNEMPRELLQKLAEASVVLLDVEEKMTILKEMADG